MKTLSFAFFVTLYLVFTHINCDIKSNYHNQESRDKYILDHLENGTILNPLPYVPLAVNVSLNKETEKEAMQLLEDTFISNEDRGKNCMRNITKCIEEDDEYKPTMDRLAKQLFSAMPPFDLSSVKGVSSKCQKDSLKYVQNLKKYKLWALQMYDSSSKLPTGYLDGNVNQLGNFDLCLSANSEKDDVYGQYCLASLQVEIPHSPYLSALHNLVHSHYAFKSKLEDPGHRVPRYSSINWALCVPSSCSSTDVQNGFKKVLDEVLDETDIDVQIKVDNSMCHSSLPKPIPFSTILASVFFLMVIAFAVGATIYDYYATYDKNEYITAFSLRKNVNSMLSTNKASGDIEAVHGIRFINALMLLFAHKSMAIFFVPYTNRTSMTENVGQPWTVVGRAASLYTDPFIMLSGTLTAYSLFGQLQRTNKIDILKEYASRLLRIVPTLAALIFFCTFVLPWLSSGPMWNQVITHHSGICKKNWWRNLLFIHNYFGFEAMCLTHTHHIGIDTQLFFVSPFMILLVWKWPKRGVFALLALALISTVMRYYVTYTMRLNNYVHFGTSIEQLFLTADNMYILPAHRATVYIMGILLGYILKNYSNITLTKVQLRLGNMLALFSFLVSFCGPAFMSTIGYVYNPTHAAWYAAFAPILWCFSFAWIIFTTHVGYRGLIGNIFSWRKFMIWTKISYTVYLTQFPAYFYNVGTIRSPINYTFFSSMLNLQEYTWILFLSVSLTLLFETPFQNIKNIIFRRKQSSKTPQPDVVEHISSKKIQ